MKGYYMLYKAAMSYQWAAPEPNYTVWRPVDCYWTLSDCWSHTALHSPDKCLSSGWQCTSGHSTRSPHQNCKTKTNKLKYFQISLYFSAYYHPNQFYTYSILTTPNNHILFAKPEKYILKILSVKNKLWLKSIWCVSQSLKNGMFYDYQWIDFYESL